MKSPLKNSSIVIAIQLAAMTCLALTANAGIIYSNTNDSGYVLPLSSGEEVIDYGRTTNGGLVTSFKFGFATDTHYPGSVKVRFYEGTSYYSRGSLLKTFQVSLPYVSDTGYWYEREYSIPSSQQFMLPSGAFGYSLEFSGSYNYAVYASGGLGNEAYFWMYVQDLWDWTWSWERISANGYANAGLYMQVKADPVEYCNFSGYKYEDKDNDGQKDADESGLQGWTIYVDTNNNDKFDQNEPNSVTDANGYYSITNVPVPLIDSLREVMKGGWEATYPENGEWNLWSWSGTNNLNFHNKKVGDGMISGYKFNDANADGQWNNGEDALQGWRIYIDENQNGQFESTEPNDITDPNGFYEITGLDAPASHIVAEVMQNGWNQTLPGGEGTYLVSTEPNTPIENINFGNTTQPVITYVKISGHVTKYDGTALEGVKISGSAFPDVYTDENGYYECQVRQHIALVIIASKEGWVPIAPQQVFVNTSDIVKDFTMYCAYSGGNGTEYKPYLISTAYDLYVLGMQQVHWNNHFKLIANLNMSDYTGTEFNSIGYKITNADMTNENKPFKGTFDGDGHTISNFTYETPTEVTSFNYMGLFGYVSNNAVIKNIKLKNPTIHIRGYRSGQGLLIGMLSDSKVVNCHVEKGTISGNMYTGGMIGYAGTGIIEKCSVTDTSVYSGYDNSGNFDCGGLIGNSQNTAIRSCYSSGISVYCFRSGYAGGLVGSASNTNINNSYTSGLISSGGLGGTSYMGGFYGLADGSTTSNCYSLCKVEGIQKKGAFTGNSFVNSYESCFWEQETNPGLNSAYNVNGDITGIDRMNKDQLQSISTFIDAGWDMENIWRMCDGSNYPKLAWEPKIPGDITCPDGVGIEDLAELASQWHLTKLQSDFKPDGKVDMTDLSMIASAWQTSSGQPNYNLQYDVAPQGGDGVINQADLAVLASDWLSPSAHSADIAPDGGDGMVDITDLIVIAENWLSGR